MHICTSLAGYVTRGRCWKQPPLVLPWSHVGLAGAEHGHTCEVGGKDGHLGGPSEQLLSHGLCGAGSGQHGPALGIQRIHIACPTPCPECLCMLQQLRAAPSACNQLWSATYLEGRSLFGAKRMVHNIRAGPLVRSLCKENLIWWPE